MSVRGFRATLRSFVPVWLSDRPSLHTGFSLLYAIAGLCDYAMQASLEGVRAAWPGYDSRVDQLTLLGQTRGLLQGETETNAHFIGRLRAWLATARSRGSDVGLATQLHEYIAGNPQVRVISRSGRFTTVATNGTVTVAQGTWNWDSVSNPERNVGGAGSVGLFDYWIVVYASTPVGLGYYLKDTGTWGDGLEPPPNLVPADGDLGFGHACTRVEVDAITGLVELWKGAQVDLKALIWSYGTDYYAPTPVAGSPDGTWGKWFVRSTNLASRNTTDRFWILGGDTNS